MGVRMAIVGAGSGTFSLDLVRDLCLTPGLEGTTVAFVDIDRERLERIHGLACRYAAEVEADLHFEKTTERREALQGADFVVNTAMVIGHDKQRLMDEVARKHGSYTGIHNWRGMRLVYHHQYRLFMDVVKDMEAICPRAWHLLLANPVFEGSTLVTRNSPVKTVGLCHGFEHGVRHIARTIGLDPAQVAAQAYGVNHFIWLTDFRYQGHDAYPILDGWIEKTAPALWARPDWPSSDAMGPKACDVYRRLGLFPVGDTVTPGGLSMFDWYHTDRETEQRWKEDTNAWWARVVEHVTKNIDEIFAVAADRSVPVTKMIPPQKSAESIIALVDALANGRAGIFQVNIPNQGAIPGLPDDVVVEIPAWVSRRGIEGLHVGDLPRPIMLSLLEMLYAVERNLEAYLSGSRELLLETVLGNRWIRSVDDARRFLDEILAMPFNQDLAARFS